MRFLTGLLLPALMIAPAHTATYEVVDGSYEARAPETWDGTTPLGLLIFFHGYRSSGANVLTSAALTALAERQGYLLVAPNGRAGANGNTSWSHQGSPAQNRDELAFVDAVLADVRTHFPLADEPPVFAGFSQGGSMVWHLACERGAALGRYVAIGGGFWEPLPERCTTPLGQVVHIHGLDDRIVPLEGRPIGDSWHQGDILVGLDRFKQAAECPQTPDSMARLGALHCRSWTSCAAGEVRLCLHPGGHELHLGPLAEVLRR